MTRVEISRWDPARTPAASAGDLRGSDDGEVAKKRKNSKIKGPYRHRRWGRKQIEELERIDSVVEACAELGGLVEADLRRAWVGRAQGEPTMTPRQVLRVFIVKDMNEYDWVTLEWQLVNLESYRRFCDTEDMFPDYFRIPTLEMHLGALSAETIARVHEVLTEARAEAEREQPH